MNKTMNKTVLECDALSQCYQDHTDQLVILDQVNFALKAGESIAIVGNSGSGKTTLLNLLAGLDHPTSGEVRILGTPLSGCTDHALDRLHNESMGFVYQFHHLLSEFSALENVAIPLLLRPNLSMKALKKKAQHKLEQVGLSHRLHHKPGELSGGERQRVAIARALVGDPAVVLMDEPTGNLDTDTAEGIHQLMLKLSQNQQTGFVVVTHDHRLAQKMDRIYHLDRGQLHHRVDS